MTNKVDKQFCMSSYLMYRYVYDNALSFQEDVPCTQVDLKFDRLPVKDKTSLYGALKKYVDEDIVAYYRNSECIIDIR